MPAERTVPSAAASDKVAEMLKTPRRYVSEDDPKRRSVLLPDVEDEIVYADEGAFIGSDGGSNSPNEDEEEEVEEPIEVEPVEVEPVVPAVAILVTDHNNNLMGGDDALEMQPVGEHSEEEPDRQAAGGSAQRLEDLSWRPRDEVSSEEEDEEIDESRLGRFGAIGQERGRPAAQRRQREEDEEMRRPVVQVHLPEPFRRADAGREDAGRPNPMVGFTVLRAIWQVKSLVSSADQLTAQTRLLLAVEEQRARMRTTARARDPVAMALCPSLFAAEVDADQREWDQKVGPHYNDFMTVQTRAEDAWTVASRGISESSHGMLPSSTQFALSELAGVRSTLAARRAKVEKAVGAYQADWESIMTKVAIMSPNLYFDHPHVFPSVPTLDALLEEGRLGRDGLPVQEHYAMDEEYDDDAVLAPSDDPEFAAQLAQQLGLDDDDEYDEGFEDGYESDQESRNIRIDEKLYRNSL